MGASRERLQARGLGENPSAPLPGCAKS